MAEMQNGPRRCSFEMVVDLTPEGNHKDEKSCGTVSPGVVVFCHKAETISGSVVMPDDKKSNSKTKEE